MIKLVKNSMQGTKRKFNKIRKIGQKKQFEGEQENYLLLIFWTHCTSKFYDKIRNEKKKK